MSILTVPGRPFSGAVTCTHTDTDGKLRIAFVPHGRPPATVRFALRFSRLNDLTAPFAPPLDVRLTDDPPGSPSGVDRVGSIATCKVTTNGMICQPH